MAQGFATGNPSVFLNSAVCGGRLTASSGVPVPTTDQTSITTIYFTPYVSNTIGLYDGSSAWNIRSFSEISISVPATTSTMYDVFAYDNSGSVACETLAWTNDTTRATGISLQNGVYVKSGDSTRRYIGSFRTTTVSGQTEDSLAKRYVWNYYNRVLRTMRVYESTASWTYSTASWRQANNSTANQLDFVLGVSEDNVSACVLMQYQTAGSASSRNGYSAIGLDSTSTPTTAIIRDTNAFASTNTLIGTTDVRFDNFIVAGRHTLVWLEYGAGADTQTWYGDGSIIQSGIQGFIRG